jgi:hypothetical protein
MSFPSLLQVPTEPVAQAQLSETWVDDGGCHRGMSWNATGGYSIINNHTDNILIIYPTKIYNRYTMIYPRIEITNNNILYIYIYYSYLNLLKMTVHMTWILSRNLGGPKNAQELEISGFLLELNELNMMNRYETWWTCFFNPLVI